MPFSVYVLQIITKNDLETERNITGRVMSIVKRWCKPGMHAKRNIAYVIVSEEALRELTERLWPALDAMKDSGSIERFFVYPAPPELMSDHGEWDPLAHWLRAGRVEAGKRNTPHHVRHRQRG